MTKRRGTSFDNGFILKENTVFPHIRPAVIIILNNPQMQVLLENITFLLYKNVRIAGIIRGRALYEEIR
jgi:NADH pyrophosphatase NudC (nudix superfamily)